MKYYLEVQLVPGNWQRISEDGSDSYSEMESLRKKFRSEYKAELKHSDFRIVKR